MIVNGWLVQKWAVDYEISMKVITQSACNWHVPYWYHRTTTEVLVYELKRQRVMFIVVCMELRLGSLTKY